MQKNLGTADRIWRLLFGLFLLYIWNYGVTNRVIHAIILIIGLISVFESIVGFCYFYNMMSLSTKKKRK